MIHDRDASILEAGATDDLLKFHFVAILRRLERISREHGEGS
jgi:hypothetical protein